MWEDEDKGLGHVRGICVGPAQRRALDRKPFGFVLRWLGPWPMPYVLHPFFMFTPKHGLAQGP